MKAHNTNKVSTPLLYFRRADILVQDSCLPFGNISIKMQYFIIEMAYAIETETK